VPNRVAVIGAGIAGLSAAYQLRNEAELVIYEGNDYIGGHANTIEVTENGSVIGLDTAFIVFNRPSYPGLSAFFDELEVPVLAHEGGFNMFDLNTGVEFGTTEFDMSEQEIVDRYPASFLDIWREAKRFHSEAPRHFLRKQAEFGLGEYLDLHGYSEAFKRSFVVQLATAVWSIPPELIWEMPASTFIAFFMAHDAEGLGGRSVAWQTVQGGSISYVRRALNAIGAELRLSDPVVSVEDLGRFVEVTTQSGSREQYDSVVLSTHADQALSILRNPTPAQQAVEIVRYNTASCVLHTDDAVISKDRDRWTSWNFGSMKVDGQSRAWPVYYLNALQDLDAEQDYFVTLDCPIEVAPEKVIKHITYSHPIITCEVRELQSSIYRAHSGSRVLMAGSYFHSKSLGPDQIGSHEAAFSSGVEAARAVRTVLADPDFSRSAAASNNMSDPTQEAAS
jgi:predicted NAD/FAD-binding protein